MAVTIVEWTALLLGVACVVLGVVRSVWTFPTAIGSVVLVGIAAARNHLYSDALLQAIFIIANVYGWINWSAARAIAGMVAVQRMSARSIAAWLLVWALGTVAWATPMALFTDAARPWWDAPTAVASVIAQVLMAQRKIENWLVWIMVDAALIPLYLVQHLRGLAVLYILYLALSVWGLADWSRARRLASAVPT